MLPNRFSLPNDIPTELVKVEPPITYESLNAEEKAWVDNVLAMDRFEFQNHDLCVVDGKVRRIRESDCQQREVAGRGVSSIHYDPVRCVWIGGLITYTERAESISAFTYVTNPLEWTEFWTGED